MYKHSRSDSTRARRTMVATAPDLLLFVAFHWKGAASQIDGTTGTRRNTWRPHKMWVYTWATHGTNKSRHRHQFR